MAPAEPERPFRLIQPVVRADYLQRQAARRDEYVLMLIRIGSCRDVYRLSGLRRAPEVIRLAGIRRAIGRVSVASRLIEPMGIIPARFLDFRE
jgi:hypothetical protein